MLISANAVSEVHAADGVDPRVRVSGPIAQLPSTLDAHSDAKSQQKAIADAAARKDQHAPLWVAEGAPRWETDKRINRGELKRLGCIMKPGIRPRARRADEPSGRFFPWPAGSSLASTDIELRSTAK